MRENVLIRSTDLIDNPTTRVPICLCLDTSASMEGAPINELNQGARLFYEAIAQDEVAAYSAEICIVTFGLNGVQVITDFTGFYNGAQPPVLSTGGMTPMGEAVMVAMDMLKNRKQQYKDNGVDYFQPWLVLMTDGEPNGDQQIFENAANLVTNEVNNRKLSIFPIGVGRNPSMRALARFSGSRTPLRLKGLMFREFFQWLSQSVSATSQSTPGESMPPLDLEGLKGWATL